MAEKNCFLCGRPMKSQEGLLYDLCTNSKCPRSKPLAAPTSHDEGTSSKDNGAP